MKATVLFLSRYVIFILKAGPHRFFLQKSLDISNKSCTFAAPEPAKPLNDAQMCGSFLFLYNE